MKMKGPPAIPDPIWERYVKDRSKKTREEIIVKYHPLVERVAGKMHKSLPPQVDIDDIVQFGAIGLMRAVEHYDPFAGVNFETYAVASIRGLILDELRTLDWVPRSLRRRQREIDKARDELEKAFGRSPSVQEVAAHLGVSADDVTTTLAATEAARTKSLDEPTDDGEGRSKYESVSSAADDPETSRQSSHIYATLSTVIRDFTLQEQLVLVLYYYEGLTLAEVGRVVGIPESRASQIHTKTMMEIRDHLLVLLKA